MCENILSAYLLESQHLLEVLQTSLTFKNSEKVVKSGCFKKFCDGECQFFFEMKEGYKISSVKILTLR